MNSSSVLSAILFKDKRNVRKGYKRYKIITISKLTQKLKNLTL